MNGQELAEAIADAVNSGIDPLEFQAELKRSHNALQRYAFRQVLKPGIIALAEVEYTDRRNEKVVQESRTICEKMGWDYEKN